MRTSNANASHNESHGNAHLAGETPVEQAASDNPRKNISVAAAAVLLSSARNKSQKIYIHTHTLLRFYEIAGKNWKVLALARNRSKSQSEIGDVLLQPMRAEIYSRISDESIREKITRSVVDEAWLYGNPVRRRTD